MWSSVSTVTSVIRGLELLDSKANLIFCIELNGLNILLEGNTICIRRHEEVKNPLLPW